MLPNKDLYRHTDGGLYEFQRYAKSADTGKDVVIYQHLWPFTQDTWVRDREEFEARFTNITEKEYHQIKTSMTREDAQAAIIAAKAIRRAKSI
jgi:hypothetical protein